MNSRTGGTAHRPRARRYPLHESDRPDQRRRPRPGRSAGTGRPREDAVPTAVLPSPPSWRTFDGGPVTSVDLTGGQTEYERRLGVTSAVRMHDLPTDEGDLVNAALCCAARCWSPAARDRQVHPGLQIARELGLGRVLRWPITSRSTLQRRPVRLRRDRPAAQARRRPAGAAREPCDLGGRSSTSARSAPRCCRTTPRVLLIDELDKSDIDLPNDLLNVFEDGEFRDPRAGSARRAARPA